MSTYAAHFKCIKRLCGRSPEPPAYARVLPLPREPRVLHDGGAPVPWHERGPAEPCRLPSAATPAEGEITWEVTPAGRVAWFLPGETPDARTQTANRHRLAARDALHAACLFAEEVCAALAAERGLGACARETARICADACRDALAMAEGRETR